MNVVFKKLNGRSFGSKLTKLEKFVSLAPVVTPPTAPSNLVVTPTSTTNINLSWSDNSADETGFEIEYSANGVSGWTALATKAANSTSHSDTVSSNTLRYYRVRAVKNGTYSDWTSAVAARSFFKLFSVTSIETANPDAYAVNEDEYLSVPAFSGYVNNDTCTSGILIGNPIHGTLDSVNEFNGAFNYMPDADYNGLDYFYYQGLSEDGFTDITKVTIQVVAQPN